jgi:contact-dependent growth inhibition (CDI) system CdiI-like immunity protein
VSVMGPATLESLEGEYWGDPPPGSTYLVRTVHHLRRKAVVSLSSEDLRIMIGQSVGLDHLIPRALDVLVVDPLVQGDLYPGDLLTTVLRVERPYWLGHLDGLRVVEEIAADLDQLDEPVSSGAGI